MEVKNHSSDEVFVAGDVAHTATGRQIPYDLLLWCVGGRPNTAYLQANFAHALNDRGQVRVTPELQVLGQKRMFALGDITDLVENKMAWVAGSHVKIAAANITMLLYGAHARLKSYKAKTGNPMMAVTLGRRSGVTHLPSPIGVVRAAWVNRKLKTAHMLVPVLRKSFGL